ncbi:MAG: hypothetical protein CL790_01685 [Chloroflexi bacterium]|nr:hypothetical protein [Chloroflexota bacterium]HCU73604.1 hypothetical protein [Chloroflexota bacterium]
MATNSGSSGSRRWQILKATTIYRDEWVTHTQEHVRLPNGHEIPRYNILNQTDFCTMIAVTPSGLIPLVKQYKHGALEEVMEFPAGLVDKGETAQDAAIRELREETGYAGNIVFAGRLLTNPTRCRNMAHVFVITDAVRAAEPRLEVTEDIEVELVHISKLEELVKSGKFRDVGSLAAYTLAKASLPDLGWEEV